MTKFMNSLKMKTWAVSLLLLSLVATPTYALTPEWVKSVVMIQSDKYLVKQYTSYRAQGSGVVINISRASKGWESYILTNAHNTYKTVKVLIKGTSNNLTKALYTNKDVDTPSFIDNIEVEVLKVDKDIDLALLKLTTKEKPKTSPATISSAELEVADWVIAIGYPGGFGRVITDGYVGETAASIFPTMFLHSSDTARGNSGGGVFREKKLVGISRKVAFNQQNIPIYHVGFAIPMEHILDFLKEYKNLLTIVKEK